MTLKELREQTKDLPEDTVICNVTGFGGEYYEISTYDYYENGEYLAFDEESEEADIPTKGNLLIF